jgi:hypothetical protein
MAGCFVADTIDLRLRSGSSGWLPEDFAAWLVFPTRDGSVTIFPYLVMKQDDSVTNPRSRDFCEATLDAGHCGNARQRGEADGH